MKKYFIGYYNPSVIVTYLGALLSFIAVYMAMKQEFGLAVCILMFSGLCDTVDGAIARMVNRSESAKCFGAQIDSLCDLAAFGVAPAVIGVTMYQGDKMEALGVAAGCCIILAVVIRLAFFNVEEEQVRNGIMEKRQSYRGLPCTNSVFALSLSYCIGSVLPFPMSLPITCSVLLFLAAFLFIFDFRVPVLHKKGRIVFVIIGFALFFTMIFVIGV